MKFGKIIFLMFILVISMSFVNAADNMTSQALPENNQQTDDVEIADEINITFEEKVYRENLSNIAVDLPENVSGNLEVKINDYTLYNGTVNTTKISIPIELPPQKFPAIVPNVWPPFDSTTYNITAFYNDIELNVTHDLKVMLYPRNHTPRFLVPEEVLQFGKFREFMPAILFPRSARGCVEIYLDGKIINRTDVDGPFVFFNQSLISSLSLGNHEIMMNYSGDDYFISHLKILTFTVTNAVINIPKTIYLDHDDCISVETASSGYVSLYIDSKLITKKALDKSGELLYSLFNDITCGNHEIKVVVDAKNFTRTKIINANTTYSIEFYPNYIYRYGEENYISVYIPEDLEERLFRVMIDGQPIHTKKSGQDLLIDISKLGAGNYTINVSYLGDDKYFPISICDNFTIGYVIRVPDTVYFGDSYSADIILPANAKGSLEVYLDDKLYNSAKLVNGKALIKLNNLNPREYHIKVRYTGIDYSVDEVNGSLTVCPTINYESSVHVGDKNLLYFKVPKNCRGKISAKIGSKTYAANIKNGVAMLDLSGLQVGDWDFYLKYAGEDGYEESYFVGVCVDYAPIKIRALKSKVIYGIDYYGVKVIGRDGKVIKNAFVTFKVNSKTIKNVKTNSLGIAKVRMPVKYAPKKYTVTAIYKSVKLSKKVIITHLIALKTFKIKKSSDLVLKASLKKAIKGKTVVFKFKGKKYIAKTNKKGIAVVIIKKSALKNLRVGSKVVIGAAYLKDALVKTAKVIK